MTYQCLTVYIKAFQMLVLLNLMRPSLSTTRVIAMTILQLIAEKRPMIPTIVSCMHLNFNYIYIYIYSHYCSNYCCIINYFSHCTNYFYFYSWQVRDRYGGRDLRLAREGSGSCAPTSGSTEVFAREYFLASSFY